jgi:hypothetical protein
LHAKQQKFALDVFGGPAAEFHRPVQMPFGRCEIPHPAGIPGRQKLNIRTPGPDAFTEPEMATGFDGSFVGRGPLGG